MFHPQARRTRSRCQSNRQRGTQRRSKPYTRHFRDSMRNSPKSWKRLGPTHGANQCLWKRKLKLSNPSTKISTTKHPCPLPTARSARARSRKTPWRKSMRVLGRGLASAHCVAGSIDADSASPRGGSGSMPRLCQVNCK